MEIWMVAQKLGKHCDMDYRVFCNQQDADNHWAALMDLVQEEPELCRHHEMYLLKGLPGEALQEIDEYVGPYA
jgi:hypothetical protein